LINQIFVDTAPSKGILFMSHFQSISRFCALVILVLCGMSARSRADAIPMSLNLSAMVDTVWLHVEPMGCETAERETLYTCDAMIEPSYYPAIATALQKPISAGQLSLCCKEPSNSFIDLRSRSAGPVRIYLWGCNVSTGTIQIGEAVFNIDFGPEMTWTLTQAFQRNRIIQLTDYGKQKAEERKRDAMDVLQPLIRHVNSFSGRKLDTIERYQRYGLSAPRASSLSKMVANLKEKAKEDGIVLIWDTTEYRYDLPADNK
jgi:hypothetical protein